ncbi:hypothetical protein [Luteimonas sp. e5]
MASREDWIALMLARMRGMSLRPLKPGLPESWRAWLAAHAVPDAATLRKRNELVAILAARPPAPLPPIPDELGRWARWRGLLDQGWDPASRTPPRLHRIGMAVSLLVNALFALLLFATLYLRLGGGETETETVRIRITGFGIPDQPGGGEEARDGEREPGAAAEAAPARSAPAQAALAASTAAAATAQATTSPTPPEPTPPVEQPQPLQVTEVPAPTGAEFVLPPQRELAAPESAAMPVRERALPDARELPMPLPEVRELAVPAPASQPLRPSQAMPSTREIPVPVEAPRVAVRELQPRADAPHVQVRTPGERPLPSAAPAMPGSASPTPQAGGTTPARAASGAGSGQQPSRAAGLPDAQGRSPSPGQAAPGAGVGPERSTASSGWPTPRAGDDWGLDRSDRAGTASGGDQGATRGQGGSRLFNADGSAKLPDDRFAARFPDPYKEGTWLRRPGMDTRGTMFDGIWRPPETLLQEWVRRGVQSVDIPLPGGKVKIRCVISVLQAAGGCLPVPGKEGVHDQPARARPAPDVPFKPELFENPQDLSAPKPAVPASRDGQPAADDTP